MKLIKGKYTTKEWCDLMNQRHYSKPFLSTFHAAEKSAKKKNILFSLTYEDFLEFTKIPACSYCNSEINWIPNGTNHRYNLDRKDNKLGYIKENLVVCCWPCNNLKGNKISFDDFSKFAELVLKPRNTMYWAEQYGVNQFMDINNFDY